MMHITIFKEKLTNQKYKEKLWKLLNSHKPQKEQNI